MSVAPETQPLVSVIIPVYNGEEFIERCLDSVLAQSMQDFELIVVNDGSTDDSLRILNTYAAAHKSVRVLDQENAGQGAARNRALGEARGEFILFVDADDFIERVTLQVTTERAVEDGSDLVHFDWKLYTPGIGRPGDFHYYNADPFWHKRVLLGPECDELLRVQNFYSVTKLYRRSFLDNHGIRFEEGRIYEDNPFVLQAVNRAEKASLVHSPLYTIDPRPDSSTRSHTDSDKHVRDHLYAVRRTFELLNRRNPRASAYLAAYHVKKIGPYYERRVPKRYRREYVQEFVAILQTAQIDVPTGTSTNAPTRLAFRWRMFEHNRALMFQAMIAGKNAIMPRFKRVKRWVKRLKHRRTPAGEFSSELERALEEPILDGSVTFLGLDFKYTGNSRYLFEQMVGDPRFSNRAIRFVTTDARVDPRYRMDPAAADTYSYLARTQILIAESWIPSRVRKHRASTWIQLWHGTPLKRMLFDSHEPRITSARRHHKAVKYRDTLNWDYLVVDSPTGADKFETAFLYPRSKMIPSGYPRVEYLLKASEKGEIRSQIRSQLGIHEDGPRKLILYAPTWRDSNYGRIEEQLDFGYVLNIAELAGQIGPDYLIVFHDHGYLASRLPDGHPRCIDASDIETQDLILAADVVVTDYSSIAFDALAIDRPVIYYAPDVDDFEANRGLYNDLWERVCVPRVTSAAEVVEVLGELKQGTGSSLRYPDTLLAALESLEVKRSMGASGGYWKRAHQDLIERPAFEEN